MRWDIAITFSGGLLFITLIISLLNSIMTGALLKWVIKSLGGKDTKKAG